MVACSPDSPYGDVVAPRDLDPASEIVVSWRKSVQDWRDHWFGLTTAPLLYADSMQVVNSFLGSEMMWAIVPAAAARALEKEGRAKICRLNGCPTSSPAGARPSAMPRSFCWRTSARRYGTFPASSYLYKESACGEIPAGALFRLRGGVRACCPTYGYCIFS